MQPIPLIDLKAQYATIRPEVERVIADVLQTTRFIGGPRVREFEAAFARIAGHREVIGCGNGTDALELVLDAWEIGPGHEVIVPAMSWISTSEIVVTRGATPVFADVDPDTYCIDPYLVEGLITPATKAIVAVHLYGHPADLDALRALADAHDLYLIEDCAQAHGARYRDRSIGTLGHAATYSFFPSKSLGAYGDAGAVATDDADLALRVRALSNHGMPGRRHHHVYHGRNSRLDSLQAAVLNVKAALLPAWIAQKNRAADRYRALLADLDGNGLYLPRVTDDVYHGYHLFVIRTDRRDELATFLTDKGIANTVHYPTALPLHACYAGYGYAAADYPVAIELSATALSLPMFAELTEAQQAYISEALHTFFAA